MSYTAFQALVRRDLRLFFQDRRAVTMSFVAPIVIASFFGYIFGGAANDSAPSKIAVAVVDRDNSEVSRKVIAALGADAALDVKGRPLEEAREAVRGGKTTVAAVIPPGFAEGAGKAFFRGGDKPEIQLLFDPSHNAELQMVRGVLMQHVMEIVSRETMGGPSSQRLLDDALRNVGKSPGMNAADQAALRRMLQGVEAWNQRQRSGAQAPANPGFSMPYTVSQEAVTAHRGVPYNSMAHSFAGMCVQFILFMGIDAGMVVLYQRRTGLWKRLQAAPLSRYMMIGSRAASAAIVAMVIMFTVFGFARVVFGVRIEGSFAGFLGVCVAFAMMTATFGLLVAVLGKTPEATRGIAILATLVLVMLGGSWVPAFLFPQWLQKLSFAVPTRWAVDGLDAMVWRGSGLEAALGPIGALLAFAAVFGAIAVWRFRWET
jgi:ABC-2 type transport system permease protein